MIFFRKRKDTSVYDGIPEILDSMEEEIEKQLDAKAEKSNLTVANVKSILKVCIYRYRIMHNCIEPYDRHTLSYTAKRKAFYNSFFAVYIL